MVEPVNPIFEIEEHNITQPYVTVDPDGRICFHWEDDGKTDFGRLSLADSIGLAALVNLRTGPAIAQPRQGIAGRETGEG